MDVIKSLHKGFDIIAIAVKYFRFCIFVQQYNTTETFS